ncbi:hypothetical protein AAFF_G00307420 [Aldrovandia affinis]|uniref:Uncharacterized protein n=1 Tax=Aldrovandia affinis TaxID=143900 RepID=A0AAD7R7U2_9TELE|nr:hypothetical protein AAFF_G00307420 [Aldrovandia affinis]
MTYPEVDNITLLTDMTYRRTAQEHFEETGTSKSPLCSLPINMVTQIPIDYMHQSCLGVMKKLILVWLRGARRGIFCYWPRHNVKSRIKHCELPDKAWKQFPARIFMTTGSYTEALQRSRLALETSNVDSDHIAERNAKRRKRIPAKLQDVGSEQRLTNKRPRTRSESSDEDTTVSRGSTPVAGSFQAERQAGHESLSPIPSVHRPSHQNGSAQGSQKEASELPVSAERGGPTKVQQQLLMKIDAILANLAEILPIVRKILTSGAPDVEEDILQRPCRNEKELQELLRGKKGKRTFGDLNVCQIITKTCLLNFKHAKVTDVESLIGATLKFAPHRGKQQKKPIEDHREQPDH